MGFVTGAWGAHKGWLKPSPESPDPVLGYRRIPPRYAGVEDRLGRIMDEIAYIMESIAGVIFLTVGVRLYLLSRRTR